LQLNIGPAEYGVPVKDIARLGLGDVQISRGIALQGYASSDPGRAEFQEAVQIFDQAIQTLNDTLPAFQAPNLNRYLAQNHQFLGIAYQSSGYSAEAVGDPSAARLSYQQAIQQFDACIALGENTTDRVIQSEIIEADCIPLRQISEERLQALDGGS